MIKFHSKDDKLIPVRATAHSAGYDLKASHSVLVKPYTSIQDLTWLDTGVSVEMPDNMTMLLAGRSSNPKRGLIIPQGVAVVDADYHNTIKVCFINISDKPVKIDKYDRVAQGVFVTYHTSDDKVTAQRTGGIGSTGIK